MSQAEMAAVVLAAGYSSRMGSLKPLLDLDGRPVISQVVCSLRKAGIQDVRIVAGYNKESLLPVLEELQVRTIINDKYADGMFSSVLAGLGSLEPEVKAFFLLPVDIPLVRSQTLRYLAEKLACYPGKILIPGFMGRKGHPPLIPVEFIRNVVQYRGGGGLKGALSTLTRETITIPVPDENILFDMDIPAKYSELLERWKRRHVPSLAECEAIVAIYRVAESTLKHCRAVADTAGSITDDLNRAGCSLDRDLITAGALLHDIARDKPNHAREGARLVAEMGFPEVAKLISTHMDIPASSTGSVSAADVLYLADKLVQEEKQVSLADRFGRKLAKYLDDPRAVDIIVLRYRIASSIEHRVRALTGNRAAALV